MPLRIAIAGAIVLCACLIVPVSVKAVSSQDGTTESAEDSEPPEPYSSSPSAAPVTTTAERAAGGNFRAFMGAADIHTAGYGGAMSWLTLLMIIGAGFLPAILMIIRSTQRRRAGPPGRPA